jgi:hypothetical protein
MKTTSALYKDAQKSNLLLPVRKIELFRQLANGSGWEATATNVTMEVKQLDRLSWKLDTDALNEFKVSNMRITVDNSSRLWDDSSVGRFANFLRYGSKIRISLGLTISGSPEIFPIFTGVIQDVIEESSTPTVQLDIQSLDTFLSAQSAEPAAILVANELLGVGDGVKSDFTTAKFPVGLFKEVRVGGVPVRPVLRYTASALGDPTGPAKISFVAIKPAPGQEVRADYLVWKTNEKIEQVVQNLMALVPQINIATIEPVVFSPPAQREILHTYISDFSAYDLRLAQVQPEDPPPQNNGLVAMNPFDTKAKWQAGTASRINFARVANGIEPFWTAQYEGDYLPGQEEIQEEGSTNPFWQELPSSPPATRTPAGGVLSVVQNGTSDYYILDLAEDAGPSKSIYARIRASKITGDIEIGTIIPGSNPVLGAKLWFDNLSRVRVRTNNGFSSSFNVDVTQFHNYRLTFTMASKNSGTWQLYIDGTQVGSGTVGKADALDQQGIFLHSVAGGGGNSLDVDYLRYYGATNTFPVSTWSQVIDYGIHFAGLVQAGVINTLGPFFADIQGNPASIQFFFSWSADGVTYSTEQQVASGANLGSFTTANAPRFIKIRIQITGNEDPVLVAVKRLFLPALAVSNVIDGGDGIVSWDTWSPTVVAGNGAVANFTATVVSSNPSGFGFYQVLGSGNAIQTGTAAKAQGYTAQKLVFISLFTTTGPTSPFLRESVFDFTTATVLVSMVNLGGLTVLDAIDELAKIADFEIGFDGNGQFFFRNKAAQPTSLLTLDGSNLQKVQSFQPGWDRIYNQIKATFGSFVKQVDSQTQNEPAPTSIQRFGTRILTIGGGNLVFQTDVDLATVMAVRYFTRYKEPKRRATVIARYMPEVELGDRVTLNINFPRQIAQTFDARILGIAHQLMDFVTELDLQEI